MPNHTIIDIPEDTPEGRCALESWKAFLARHGLNITWIIGRNTVSVAIPTFIREVVRRELFTKIPADLGAKLFGGVAGYLPVLMQGYGMYRDVANHTHTRYTIIGRTAAIMISGSSVACLIALGAMTPGAAAALAASNFIYTPLRDILQNYIRREDNTNTSSLQFAMWPSSILYGFNQFGVNEGMQGLSNVLTAHMRESIANGFGRAAVNLAGETLDDLTLLNLQAAFEGTGLEVRRPRFSPPSEHSWNNALDRGLNIHPGRSSLLSTVFSSAYIADHLSGENFLIESGAVGFAAFASYLTFMSGMMQTAPRHYDLEAARQNSETSPPPVSLTRVYTIDETRL